MGRTAAEDRIAEDRIEALRETMLRAILEIQGMPIDHVYATLVRVLVMLAIEERGPRYAVRQFPALLADNVRFEVQRQLRVKGEDQPVH